MCVYHLYVPPVCTTCVCTTCLLCLILFCCVFKEAKKVVQKEILEFKNDKILAKSYFPEEEKITPAPSPVDTSASEYILSTSLN